MNTAPAAFGRHPAVWLLVAVFIAELLLFDHYGSRRVTSIYPRWNDQIQYLSEAYTGYEYGREHGFPAALWHTLVNPSAQGTLHDFAAVIVFQFTGPSRSAALAINLLALLAWQLALFSAVHRRSASAAIGFAAAMLPLALAGPWQDVPGSAYDFRLDHLAMCALGVCAATALLTDQLRSRGWSVAFGATVGIALLTRFLTGTYFILIFGAFAIQSMFGRDRTRRIANLATAGVVAAIMAGPIFWLNREALWNYYYIGHYVGPESAIRNQNFGLSRSIEYVAYWLGTRHLGTYFGILSALGAVLFGAARFASGKDDPRGGSAKCARNCPASTIFVGLVFLLAPAVVLVLHPQKSEVVISALAPGAVMIVIGAWLALGRRSATANSTPRTAEIAIAIVIGLASLAWFAKAQSTPFLDPATLANLRQVNAVADYVFDRAQATDRKPIRVAVDYITDALDAQVLRVICYERHRRWCDFDMKLPTGIAEPDPATVRARIADSDFVFLTDASASPGRYPYDTKLAQLEPELRAWCASHFMATKRFTLLGRSMTLYERPPPSVR